MTKSERNTNIKTFVIGECYWGILNLEFRSASLSLEKRTSCFFQTEIWMCTSVNIHHFNLYAISWSNFYAIFDLSNDAFFSYISDLANDVFFSYILKMFTSKLATFFILFEQRNLAATVTTFNMKQSQKQVDYIK